MKANENNDKAIYIDIQKEMSEKIKKIELNEQVFKNKLIILQKKLLQIAKLKCKDTYMWFEKLGEPYVDEKGALQLKFGKNIEENKSYYKELEKCVSKYDYGVQFEMQIQKRKNKEISESNNLCIESCDKKQYDLKQAFAQKKSCLKECISTSLNKNLDLKNILEIKIYEAIKKIDKQLL